MPLFIRDRMYLHEAHVNKRDMTVTPLTSTKILSVRVIHSQSVQGLNLSMLLNFVCKYFLWHLTDWLSHSDALIPHQEQTSSLQKIIQSNLIGEIPILFWHGQYNFRKMNFESVPKLHLPKLLMFVETFNLTIVMSFT